MELTTVRPSAQLLAGSAPTAANATEFSMNCLRLTPSGMMPPPSPPPLGSSGSPDLRFTAEQATVQYPDGGFKPGGTLPMAP